MFKRNVLVLLTCLLWNMPAMAQYWNFSLKHWKRGDGRIDQYLFHYSGKLASYGDTRLVLKYYQDGQLYTPELDVSPGGATQSGVLNLPRGVAAFAVLVTRQGMVDNNNGKGYIFHPQDSDIPEAEQDFAVSRWYGQDARQVGLEPDYAKALTMQEKVFSKHPEMRTTHMVEYLLAQALADPASFLPGAVNRGILEDTLRNAVTERSLVQTLPIFDALQLPVKKDSLVAVIMQRFPQGTYAAGGYLDSVLLLHGRDSLAQAVAHFAPRFPGITPGPRLDSLYFNAAWAFIGDDGQSMHYLDMMTNKRAAALGYRAIAQQLLKDSTTGGPRARVFSYRALVALDDAQHQVPLGVSMYGWQQELDATDAAIKDVYAAAMFACKQLATAVVWQKKAVENGPGENGLYLQHYFKYLQAVNAPAAFLEEVSRIYQEYSFAFILPALQQAYLAARGSSGFEAYKAGLDYLAQEKVLQGLAQRMMPVKYGALAAHDLNGRVYTMDELKGKIVILDFWATWCGPCVASFPAMEEVVKEYKNSPDVVVLFVNTGETDTNDQLRERHIHELLGSHYPDFKVLMDDRQDGHYLSNDRFKILGLPTKIVLDAHGTGRYLDIGYDGDAGRLVNNMKMLVTLLRRETQQDKPMASSK